MTNDLRQMLEERADSVPAPTFDAAAIMAAGRRRRAGRTVALVVGAVAATVVMAAAASLSVPGTQGVRVATSPPSSNPSAFTDVSLPIAFAAGETLHVGSTTLDLGARPVVLAQTPAGFVFADEDGEVHSVVGTQVDRLGQLEAPFPGTLASDGTVVAWVDRSPQGDLRYAAVDLATGQVAHSDGLPTPSPSDTGREFGLTASVVAVDGGEIYTRSPGGARVWNAFGDGSSAPLPPGRVLVVMRDAKAGVMHWMENDEVVTGRSLADGEARETWAGMLSPDGAHLLSAVDDQARVIRLADDAAVEVTHASTALEPYRWLDATHFAALAFATPTAVPDLVRCSLSTGECSVEVSASEVAAADPNASDATEIVLPTASSR